jgi:hypothetical protein
MQRNRSFHVASSVALLSALHTPSLRAQPSDPTAASAEYRKAYAAMAKEDWRKAREILLTIWKTNKTYDVASSLGQVEFKLAHYGSAARFMAFALDHVAPSEKPEFIQRLKTRYASSGSKSERFASSSTSQVQTSPSEKRHWARHQDKTVCDTTAGECVPCTGKDYAACGESMGTPLVCDSGLRTCTANKEHSGDLCRPCVSDAHCPAGQLCVKETFGQPAADVGNFCFWKKGDIANGAPATCSVARPYSSPIADQTSVDGSKAEICGLGSSTCVARNDVADSKDCATGNVADNSKCGFTAGVDSKSVDKGGDFRCTMACASSEDCPGNLACDGTSFCKL